VLVVVAGVACDPGVERGAEVVGGLTASPNPAAAPSPSATTPAPMATPAPSMSPVASPTEPDHKPAILVKQPESGAQAFSPVVISGSANVPSGVVAVRVLDAQGTELAAMAVDVSCGASCRGTFRAELAFFAQVEQEGTVEVWEPMPNGTQEHIVRVPVVLVPGV